ncbi:hypothetical protein HanRHA438_Chr02g0052811 [Helianthus annuus]|nr:hypothetical protein HanRHA438_Chr02g0052811 [Helianthus annuus]
MEFLDGVSVCDQNGNKREKSGTRRQKKNIWTKMANLDKTQGLKWQFTPIQTFKLGYHLTILV